MSKLVAPHGGKGLVCCLLEGKALEDEKKKAAGLKQIEISSRAKGDLIMMGIGGFSPLKGFMDKADWKSVCEKMTLSDVQAAFLEQIDIDESYRFAPSGPFR